MPDIKQGAARSPWVPVNGGTGFQLAAAGVIGFLTRSQLSSPADGDFMWTNNAGSAGVRVKVSSDGLFNLRARADGDYANLYAKAINAFGALTAQSGYSVASTQGYLIAGSTLSKGAGHTLASSTYVQTTDATVTTAWQTPVIAEGEAIAGTVHVIGLKTDGTEVGIYIATFGGRRQAGGNVIAYGTPQVVQEDDAAWACAIDADTTAQTVRVRVTGAAGKTINWRVSIIYQKDTV